MKNFKKVIKVFINTLMALIIIMAFILLILYAIGIRPFIVQSGSMETQIHVGSICFINERVKYEDIQVGDIIAFELPGGMKVTHRVIGKTADGIETKGDANEPSDGISTTRDNYLGKNVFCIQQIGYVVKAIQTPFGIFITICLGLLIVLLEVLLEKSPESDDVKNKDKKHEIDTEEKDTEKTEENNINILESSSSNIDIIENKYSKDKKEEE